MIKRTLITAVHLLLLAPGLVAAQGDITINITAADGRTITNTTTEFTNVPINGSECESDIGITLDFRGVDSTLTLLDVWRSTGNDCSDSTQRSGDTATCTSLSAANVDINGATDVEGETFQIQDFVPCTDGTYTIYFLAADTAVNTGAVTNYGTLEIEVDTQSSSGVSELSVSDGESSISVSWELPSDGDINHLEIYAEVGACEETTLMMNNGAAVPSGLTAHDDDVASTVTSYDVGADSVGLGLGEELAVGVVVVDDAGNQSTLSVACASRVTTDGFCDVYAAQTGQACPQDCAVSTPGSAPGTPSPAWVLLALCGLLGFRRRR